jgi:hypothetical protein
LWTTANVQKHGYSGNSFRKESRRDQCGSSSLTAASP